MLPARPANLPIPSSTRVRTVYTSSLATTVVLDEVLLLSRLVSPPKSASEERCRVKQPHVVSSLSILPLTNANKTAGFWFLGGYVYLGGVLSKVTQLTLLKTNKRFSLRAT